MATARCSAPSSAPIIFAVIANLLSLLNVSTFLQDAFRGALILVAVTLATVQFARENDQASDRSPQPSRPVANSTGEDSDESNRRPGIGCDRVGDGRAATALLALAACGQIYPSTEPAQGPAERRQGRRPQRRRSASPSSSCRHPYFAAMQVQVGGDRQGAGVQAACSRPPTRTRSSR